MNPVRSLLAVLLLMALPAMAQEVGTLSLVEGPLWLIRGTTVLQGAEGVRLHQGDIVESSNPGFVQLEFDDGTIVALGASTRVLLFGRATGRDAGGNAEELLLLNGWLKAESKGAYRYSSPILAAWTQNSSLVLHCSGTSAEIFVESGSARIGEIGPDSKMRDAHIAGAGQFSSREAGKGVEVSARPGSSFVQAMPIPFRDTLPSRKTRFAGRRVQPKRDHEVSYSDIQPWLTTGLAWRRGFVRRFQPRLQDRGFRMVLEAHLKDHPEWGPVLHPELYQTKTLPANTDRQTSGR